MMKVGRGATPWASKVRVWGQRMLASLGEEHAELSIVLCDDAAIERLNTRYRRKKSPTDVLSFPQAPVGVCGPAARRALGDVVISVEAACRQARAEGRGFAQEMAQLLAHGLLHLVGFDHRSAAGERRMNARADMLVAAASRPRRDRAPGREPPRKRGA